MTAGAVVAGIDRRTMVGLGMAALTTACAGCPPLPTLAVTSPAAKRLGDAHVHLFNAADLPVQGFVRFVIVPHYIPHIPQVALAIIDAAVTVLKAMAPSARTEAARRPRDAAPLDFANRLADRIEAATRTNAAAAQTVTPGETVEDSYRALAIVLRAADPARARLQPEALPTTGPVQVDRAFLGRIATQGRLAARDIGVRAALPTAMRREIAPEVMASVSDDLGALWDTIKWCYEMVVTRCQHVRDYLATIDTAERRTDLVLNLLVDYDAWLGDSPSDGSAMHDQLLFWDAYAPSVADRLEIHTFAGYDPLKHAEDRLAHGGTSAYWQALADAVAPRSTGRPLAAGFKIYPPMGFRVSGNTGTPPARDRSGQLVRQRWADHRWPLHTFGAELDSALDLFFAFCAADRVPIVAHGRHSQEASTGTGAFASPRYWFDRAQWVVAHGGKPLRASIAHWTFDEEFRAYAPRILAMNEANQAELYFDVAYSTEFLPGGDGAGFMARLADVFGPVDPNGRWLLFGSDWIMLGREPGVEHYTEGMLAAVRAVKFWSDRQDGFLHDNLRRLLDRGA